MSDEPKVEVVAEPVETRLAKDYAIVVKAARVLREKWLAAKARAPDESTASVEFVATLAKVLLPGESSCYRCGKAAVYTEMVRVSCPPRGATLLFCGYECGAGWAVEQVVKK
jgi:hypothetical protein